MSETKLKRVPAALRGQSLAEFAITLPFLILLIVGALDIGRAYFAQMSLTNAARVAARWGAAYPPRPYSGPITCTGLCTTSNPIANKMVSLAVGDVDGNVIKGSDMTINIQCTGTCSRTDSVIVTVKYRFNLITGFVIGGAPIGLTGRQEMEIFSTTE